MTVDVLFTGSVVFTGRGEPLTGVAFGVTDGRITHLVAETEAAALVGSETRRVHAPGTLLAPGFQDAHVHPVGGGVEAL